MILKLSLLLILINFIQCQNTITIDKTLNLCQDTEYQYLFSNTNTNPVAIQTDNFGTKPYTPVGKECTFKFTYLMSDYEYYILVDYIALAAADSITISDGNQTVTLTYMEENTPATFFKTNRAEITIKFSSSSIVSSAGFHAYAWTYKPNDTQPLGGITVNADSLITSQLNESIDLTLNQNGLLFLDVSTTEQIEIRQGGPCVFCNQKLTSPVDLSGNFGNVNGYIFNIKQTSNQFASVFRKNIDGTQNDARDDIQLTIDEPTTIVFFANGTLYPNNYNKEFKIKLDTENSTDQTIGFEFTTFETEANGDYLTFYDDNDEVLKKLSGPIADTSGKWYYNANIGDRWAFKLTSVSDNIKIKFTSNGAVGGAGFNLTIIQSDTYQIPTTTPYPATTTPFPGPSETVNITTFSEITSPGYPNIINSNDLQLWRLNPSNPSNVIIVYLLEYNGLFEKNTNSYLTVCVGGPTCYPWDILANFTYNNQPTSSNTQIISPLTGEVSVILYTGNTTINKNDTNVGLRFLATSLSSNQTQPSTSNNVTANVNGDTVLFDITYGYPKYVYPDTVQRFTFTPEIEGDSVYLLFVLLDSGKTFNEYGTTLTVFKGNEEEEPIEGENIYYEYSSENSNTTSIKRYIKGEKDQPLSILYQTKNGFADTDSNGIFGVQFAVIGFNDIASQTNWPPTGGNQPLNYRIAAKKPSVTKGLNNGIIVF